MKDYCDHNARTELKADASFERDQIDWDPPESYTVIEEEFDWARWRDLLRGIE